MNMNKIKDKLLDVLLYPVRLYDKLNDKKATLFAGIVLVGAIDLLLPDISAFIKLHFANKPSNIVNTNILLTVLIAVVLGIVDVTFISVPLFDFFNFIKKKEVKMYANIYKHQGSGQEDSRFVLPLLKKEDLEYKASRIKIMKVYIMSHFLFIPVSVILHYTFLSKIKVDSPDWIQYMALVIFMLIFIWSAGIMARGINTLFRFNPMFKMLTFIVVFTWNYLFGMVFDLQILNWLLKLFR